MSAERLTDALDDAWLYLWPDAQDFGDIAGDPSPNTEMQMVNEIRSAETDDERRSAASDALDFIERRKGPPRIVAALREALGES